MLFYHLSYDDKIIATSDDWDRTAVEGAGRKALSRNVLGASIWSVVTGDDTRSYLNALFFLCRKTQQPVTAHYRCDTPDKAQLVAMEIAPLPGRMLQVSHLQIPDLMIEAALPLALDRKAQVTQCSQCLRVEVAGHWQESFPLRNAAATDVDRTVCPACRAGVLHRVHRRETATALYR
jgi:hypothetical protein